MTQQSFREFWPFYVRESLHLLNPAVSFRDPSGFDHGLCCGSGARC